MYKTDNLKAGPYAACKTLKVVPTGTKFWIWCRTHNAYNNLWFYGRIAGTDTTGWMYAGGLRTWGTTEECTK
ncbi:hypothetical protein ACFP1Z_02920 [Streptomyces gamaensis]|uniref:SH3 domain-containing protein n=1 Tax=Streptomyces gamaensis TaxID=1763542 RepID=A0ABW0YRI3_9ACTN